jgi:hypothetical protein
MLTSDPAAGTLLRMELGSAPSAGASVALDTPIRITAGGGPVRWRAVVRDSSAAGAKQSVKGDGLVTFAGSSGETLGVAVRPAAGELAPGETAELRVLVGRSAAAPAAEPASAAPRETSAKFFVEIVTEPADGLGDGSALSIPVRIDPGGSGGAGLGLVVLLALAGVCFGVFVFVMVQNSR